MTGGGRDEPGVSGLRQTSPLAEGLEVESERLMRPPGEKGTVFAPRPLGRGRPQAG